MFDINAHFDQVETYLGSSCQTAIFDEIEGPHFSPSKEKWGLVTLNARIEWPTGEVLEVGDYWSRSGRNEIRHTFNYQFMESDGSCIFRLDTEGEEISYDGLCHLHVGASEERFDDDHSQLHGFRLSSVNSLTILGLVHRHLNGQPMPWDDPA